MANVEQRVMIDYRQSELLNPSGPPKNIAPNRIIAREINGGRKFPFEARQRDLVLENVKGAVGSGNGDLPSIFHGDPQLFCIISLENADGRSRIHLGVEPDPASVERELNRYCDAAAVKKRIVVRAAKIQKSCHDLPSGKVYVFGPFNLGHEVSTRLPGNGGVHFSCGVTNGEEGITIEGDPAVGVTMPVS